MDVWGEGTATPDMLAVDCAALGFFVAVALFLGYLSVWRKFGPSRGRWEVGYREIMLMPIVMNVVAAVTYYSKIIAYTTKQPVFIGDIKIYNLVSSILFIPLVTTDILHNLAAPYKLTLGAVTALFLLHGLIGRLLHDGQTIPWYIAGWVWFGIVYGLMLCIVRTQYWKLRSALPRATLLRVKVALGAYFISLPLYPIFWLIERTSLDSTALHITRAVCDMLIVGVYALMLAAFRGQFDAVTWLAWESQKNASIGGGRQKLQAKGDASHPWRPIFGGGMKQGTGGASILSGADFADVAMSPNAAASALGPQQRTHTRAQNAQQSGLAHELYLQANRGISSPQQHHAPARDPSSTPPRLLPQQLELLSQVYHTPAHMGQGQQLSPLVLMQAQAYPVQPHSTAVLTVDRPMPTPTSNTAQERAILSAAFPPVTADKAREIQPLVSLVSQLQAQIVSLQEQLGRQGAHFSALEQQLQHQNDSILDTSRHEGAVPGPATHDALFPSVEDLRNQHRAERERTFDHHVIQWGDPRASRSFDRPVAQGEDPRDFVFKRHGRHAAQQADPRDSRSFDRHAAEGPEKVSASKHKAESPPPLSMAPSHGTGLPLDRWEQMEVVGERVLDPPQSSYTPRDPTPSSVSRDHAPPWQPLSRDHAPSWQSASRDHSPAHSAPASYSPMKSVSPAAAAQIAYADAPTYQWAADGGLQAQQGQADASSFLPRLSARGWGPSQESLLKPAQKHMGAPIASYVREHMSAPIASHAALGPREDSASVSEYKDAERELFGRPAESGASPQHGAASLFLLSKTAFLQAPSDPSYAPTPSESPYVSPSHLSYMRHRAYSPPTSPYSQPALLPPEPTWMLRSAPPPPAPASYSTHEQPTERPKPIQHSLSLDGSERMGPGQQEEEAAARRALSPELGHAAADKSYANKYLNPLPPSPEMMFADARVLTTLATIAHSSKEYEHVPDFERVMWGRSLPSGEGAFE